MNRPTAMLNGKKHSWLLPLVLVSGLFWLWPFSPPTTPPTQVSYSAFLAEVRTGNVLDVAIDERFLVATLKTEVVGEEAAPGISTERLPGIDETALLTERETLNRNRIDRLLAPELGEAPV